MFPLINLVQQYGDTPQELYEWRDFETSVAACFLNISVKPRRALSNISCTVQMWRVPEAAVYVPEPEAISDVDHSTATVRSHLQLMRVNLRILWSTSRSLLQPMVLLLRLVKLAAPPCWQASSRLIHNWSQQMNICSGTFLHLKMNISYSLSSSVSPS